MTVTSPSLLDRLKTSDAQAWERLVVVYTPLIRGWLLRVGVPPADVEDLVQDVLAVVVRRFPEFEHNTRTGAFRAWLRCISANTARNFWRAKSFRPAAVGGSDFGDFLHRLEDDSDPLAAAWDREHDLHVTRKLLELIQPQFEESTWEMFRRGVLLGEPADRVAAAVGASVNAVHIAKSRVMARLRAEAAGLIES